MHASMELLLGPVRTLSVLFDGRRAVFYPQAFGEGGPLHTCHLIWCELMQLAKAYRSWLRKLARCYLQGPHKGCARLRR